MNGCGIVSLAMAVLYCLIEFSFNNNLTRADLVVLLQPGIFKKKKKEKRNVTVRKCRWWDTVLFQLVSSVIQSCLYMYVCVCVLE